MNPISQAARETAQAVEASLSRIPPGAPVDIEARIQLAASWLTFAELVDRKISEETTALVRKMTDRPVE